MKIKFWLYLILSLAIFFSSTKPIAAQIESLDWVENKYGIHILNAKTDIPKAAELLNSNGGDWSWITIVIRQDEMNQTYWQEFFELCREYHLIPIVRIATKIENNYWLKPTRQDLNDFANFLNKLNWPIRIKFVIVFNEPNRGDEWGGEANPEEYADILYWAGKIFKQVDENFWLISAGLDLAAPNKPPKYYSAENFYRQMITYNLKVFEDIDSLGSHSYPNHGFVGKPTDVGKTSIRGYNWEINYLKKLGVQKNLTAFITETGWPHQEGNEKFKKFYHSEILIKFFEQAFDIWQKDPEIIAFTPFLLNYSNQPFDHFSWQQPDGNFYSYGLSLQKKAKGQNRPPQINKGQIEKISFPFILLPNHQYKGKIKILNKGQKIWGEDKIKYCFNPLSIPKISFGPLCQINIKPVKLNQTDWFEFEFMLKNQEQITEFVWENLPPVHLDRQQASFSKKIIQIGNNFISRLKIPRPFFGKDTR